MNISISVLFLSMIICGEANLFSKKDFRYEQDKNVLRKFIDTLHCRVNLFFRYNQFLNFIESYYNQSGEICKTYCRVKPIDDMNSTQTVEYMFNAPTLALCGYFRICVNGKCVPNKVSPTLLTINEVNKTTI